MAKVNTNRSRFGKKKKRQFRYFIYLITAVAVMSSAWKIIPNLPTSPSYYDYEVKTLANTKMETEERRNRRRRVKRKVLVLNMEDGTRWECSAQFFGKHFNQLKAPKNIGKEYKIYLAKNGEKNRDPRSIEIDGKVVYGFSENKLYQYVLLTVTGLCVLLSVYLNKKAGDFKRKF